MKKLTLIAAALLSTCAFAATSAITLTDINTVASNNNDNRVELRADLEGDTLASGRARYRARSRGMLVRERFDVSIEDADPKTTYDILINGNLVGSLTTNSFGSAEVTFRSPSDDPDDIPGTPSVEAGDVVTIGPISGVLK